jgi:hypothetical protein
LADPQKIYWDSCAWIGLVNSEPARKPQLEFVYNQARNGLVQLWTSTFAIVEVNRLTAESGTQKPIPPTSIPVLDNLLFQPFISIAGTMMFIGEPNDAAAGGLFAQGQS